MRYAELSERWQREAERMEISLARDSAPKGADITVDSPEVQELLQNTEYSVVRSPYTGTWQLIRAWTWSSG